MNELTFKQILEMLQGGARKFSGGVMGVGETGMRAAGKVNENNFLNSVMGGETTATAPNLDPVAMRSMVSTNNASGTNPMMMSGAGTAGTAVASGLNEVFPTIQNLGIGARSLDGVTMPQMNATQEILDSMTPAEANVYNQLEDFQKPAFLEGLRQNKIPSYEAENFDRLMRPY